MDAVCQDLDVDGFRGRSRDGKFHYELVRIPVSISHGFGRKLDTILRHVGTFLWVKTKKADMAEHSDVFDHVGLLVNEPSSDAGVPFA